MNIDERLISNHMLGHNPVTKIFSVGRPLAAASSAGDRFWLDRFPGLERLAISVPVAGEITSNVVNPFPGVLESVWVDEDISSVRASLGALPQDGIGTFIGREHVVVGDPRQALPRGGVKLVAFVKRRDGFSVGQFQDYWANRHGPIVTRTPLLLRYVQTHLDASHYGGKTEPLFDGTAELWWASAEDYEQSWNSRAIQDEQHQDSAVFIGGAAFICLAEERVILEIGYNQPDRQTAGSR